LRGVGLETFAQPVCNDVASGAPLMSAGRPIRILLVDDHAVVREALASMLELGGDIKVVAQAGTAAEALALYTAESPDLTLLDVRMPGPDGFYALERLRQSFSGARVIMLATSALAHELRRAREFGARGFLPKQVTRAQLVAAVHTVYRGGESWEHARSLPQPVLDALSARELDVLECMRRGLTNSESGRALGISEHTVKNHVKAVLGKLEAADRAEAVARGFELGLLA
jgi:DNA-binding NarL/FixJ family response regulator